MILIINFFLIDILEEYQRIKQKMPLPNMPVTTTIPDYYHLFKARPLLWLQATRYMRFLKNDYQI